MVFIWLHIATWKESWQHCLPSSIMPLLVASALVSLSCRKCLASCLTKAWWSIPRLLQFCSESGMFGQGRIKLWDRARYTSNCTCKKRKPILRVTVNQNQFMQKINGKMPCSMQIRFSPDHRDMFFIKGRFCILILYTYLKGM